jgi:hypothetical protein
MTIKEVDAKGRIVLGKKFAGKTVIVEEIDDTEIRIIAAEVIPQREFWLHKNKNAMASVQRGLAQAKAGQVTKINPHEDDPWLEQLDD